MFTFGNTTSTASTVPQSVSWPSTATFGSSSGKFGTGNGPLSVSKSTPSFGAAPTFSRSVSTSSTSSSSLSSADSSKNKLRIPIPQQSNGSSGSSRHVSYGSTGSTRSQNTSAIKPASSTSSSSSTSSTPQITIPLAKSTELAKARKAEMKAKEAAYEKKKEISRRPIATPHSMMARAASSSNGMQFD
ncbi:hypothetical protein GQ42DRAFT_153959 [Ramicandelaber brevisporus]|nr:hypothetical protein GQ42DRAFT_153959 [Ramicandelaber brevisporus]